jgi:hypothetical protein
MNFWTSKTPPSTGQTGGQATDPNLSGQLDKLLTLVQDVVKRTEGLEGRFQSQVDSLNARIDNYSASAGDQSGSPSEPPNEPPKSRLAEISEEELATMSRRDLLQLQKEDMIHVVTSAVKDIVAPIHEQMNGLVTANSKTSLQNEIAVFVNAKTADQKVKYPDWPAYKNDMQKLMQAKKGLTVLEAYTLAKARQQDEQPEQFAEIQKKYFPEDEKPKAPEPIDFGGLQTISAGAHNSTANNLPIEQALADSFAEMREIHGPLPDLN